MNALRSFSGAGYLVVCTYPEALAERVADAEALRRGTIAVRVGDRFSIEVLEQGLADADFTRVDFVYEPGQYSVRGGIVDVFSYSESKPYRLDFFGDEVDSIRRFNISSQALVGQARPRGDHPRPERRAERRARLPRAVRRAAGRMVVLRCGLRAAPGERRAAQKRSRTWSVPREADSLLTSRNGLLADLAGARLLLLRDNLPERPATATVRFSTAPQPKFNKNFEMLADDMIRNALRDTTPIFFRRTKAQVERLENIFHQIGRGQAVVRSLPVTLHEGFADNDLKPCLYTDHQIFDRYQRYRINGEIRRDEQMTVAELNQLRPGDYVVHIDHGVGRFDGLVKIEENGKTHEAIKLVYKDGDVLFVNVHSLHRIARYKSGDGEPPKVYKARQRRLAEAQERHQEGRQGHLAPAHRALRQAQGFEGGSPSRRTATCSTSLEASFRWEDTPDQQAATAAVKKDMESDQPMDRLVCGDVGFGKTGGGHPRGVQGRRGRQAGRRAGPTTILALQHYRSFMERLRDFPVRVEYLNRTKSSGR